MTSTQLLLVEREAHTRRLLKVSLEQAGYRVSTVRDGADALSKLELSTPDLVIAATDLPQLDGYALVRRMKAHSEWARIPVIFMISGESMEDKIRGLELGVDEYLSKPVFVRELLSRVQVLLAKRVRRDLSESAAQTRVAGSLADMTPIDLIESLVSGEQSGVLRITSGGRSGEVFFEAGQIIGAQVRQLRGEEAVYRVLGWAQGEWEVELGAPGCERTVDEATRAVIDTGVRHAGAYNRLVADVPPLEAVVKVDTKELKERTTEIPTELHGVLSLFDGQRTINDIIDDSPFDDLSTLETIARLHGEGLLTAVRGQPHTEPYLDDSAPAAGSQPKMPTEEDDEDEIYHLETTRPPAVDMPMPRANAGAAPSPEPSSAVDPRRWTEDIRDDGGAAVPAVPPSEPAQRPPEPSVSEPSERRPRFAETRVAGSLSRDAQRPEPADGDASPVAAGPRAEEASPPPESPEPEEVDADGPSTAQGHPVLAEPEEVTSPPPAAAQEDEADREPVTPTPTDSQPELSATVRSRRAPARSAAATTDDEAPSSGALLDDATGEPDSTEPVLVAPAAHGPAGPSSGRSPLSASGISAQFFNSEPATEEEPPLSEHGPVYLTEQQIARKERSKRIVAIVLGLLVAIVLYVGVYRGSGITGSTTTATSDLGAGGGATITDAVTSLPTSPASAAASGAAGAGGVAVEDAGSDTGGGAAVAGAGGSVDMEGGGGALPDVPDPLVQAAGRLNVGDYQGTIPLARAAIAKDPSGGDAYYYLALSYESLGKMEKARDVYDACVAKATRGQYLGWCRRGARKKK